MQVIANRQVLLVVQAVAVVEDLPHLLLEQVLQVEQVILLQLVLLKETQEELQTLSLQLVHRGIMVAVEVVLELQDQIQEQDQEQMQELEAQV